MDHLCVLQDMETHSFGNITCFAPLPTVYLLENLSAHTWGHIMLLVVPLSHMWTPRYNRCSTKFFSLVWMPELTINLNYNPCVGWTIVSFMVLLFVLVKIMMHYDWNMVSFGSVMTSLLCKGAWVFEVFQSRFLSILHYWPYVAMFDELGVLCLFVLYVVNIEILLTHAKKSLAAAYVSCLCHVRIEPDYKHWFSY